jgi:hypothetical protein
MRTTEPSYRWNPAEIDRPEELLAESLGLSVEQALRVIAWEQSLRQGEQITAGSETLLAVIRLFWRYGQNSRMLALALAFAAGLDRQLPFRSMREAAAANGYTVAQLSKLVRTVQDTLNLPRTAHNKTDEAVEQYAAAQKANHHTRRKFRL